MSLRPAVVFTGYWCFLTAFLVLMIQVSVCGCLSSTGRSRGSIPGKISCSEPTRRQVLAGVGLVCGNAGLGSPALAADSSTKPLSGFVASQTQAQSSELPEGLLEARVLENVMSPPSYGMEGPDVFYPDWFGGSWKVESTMTNVDAPCGIALFGGNATMDNVLKTQLGEANSLRYESRFIPFSDKRTIADREFNVKSIAKVAMGKNSVVSVSLATPNKFQCLLSPEGAPGLLTVDLIVLNRRQEDFKEDPYRFDCSEVVREIVSPVDEKGNSLPSQRTTTLLKEIETTSLYKAVVNKEDGSVSSIHCQQRSASFLLPSQQDPMAMKMFQYSRGRPVDVRFYDVVYTKR